MQQMGVKCGGNKSSGAAESKEKLLNFSQVRSAAQLGIRLRVLVHRDVIDPILWLRHTFPQLAAAELTLARPSLEDVFVTVTGKGRQ